MSILYIRTRYIGKGNRLYRVTKRVQDQKTKPQKPKPRDIRRATHKQIEEMIRLGVKRSAAESCTFEGALETIRQLRNFATPQKFMDPPPKPPKRVPRPSVNRAEKASRQSPVRTAPKQTPRQPAVRIAPKKPRQQSIDSVIHTNSAVDELFQKASEFNKRDLTELVRRLQRHLSNRK